MNKIFQPPAEWDAVIVNVLVAAGDQVLINASVARANALCLFTMEKANIKLASALRSAQKDWFKLKDGYKKGISHIDLT